MALSRDDNQTNNIDTKENRDEDNAEINTDEITRLSSTEKSASFKLIHHDHAHHILNALVDYQRHNKNLNLSFSDLCTLVPGFSDDYQYLRTFDQIQNLKRKKESIQALFVSYANEIFAGFSFNDIQNAKSVIKEAKTTMGLTEFVTIYQAIEQSNQYPSPLQLPDGLKEEFQHKIRAIDLFMHLPQETSELLLIKNIIRNIKEMKNLFALFTDEYLATQEKLRNELKQDINSNFFTTDKQQSPAKDKNTASTSPIDIFQQFFGSFAKDQFSKHEQSRAPSFTPFPPFDLFASLNRTTDKVVQYKVTLREHNKKILLANKESNCDVFYHIAHGSSDDIILEKIMKSRANLSTKDQFGNTALHLTALCGRKNLVAILIAHGADINNQNNAGNTPLHLAISTSQHEVVQLLKNKGANSSLNNKHGYDAYSLATSEEGEVKNIFSQFNPKPY